MSRQNLLTTPAAPHSKRGNARNAAVVHPTPLAWLVLDALRADAQPKSMQAVQRTLYAAGHTVPLRLIHGHLQRLEHNGMIKRIETGRRRLALYVVQPAI